MAERKRKKKLSLKKMKDFFADQGFDITYYADSKNDPISMLFWDWNGDKDDLVISCFLPRGRVIYDEEVLRLFSAESAISHEGKA